MAKLKTGRKRKGAKSKGRAKTKTKAKPVEITLSSDEEVQNENENNSDVEAVEEENIVENGKIENGQDQDQSHGEDDLENDKNEKQNNDPDTSGNLENGKVIENGQKTPDEDSSETKDGTITTESIQPEDSSPEKTNFSVTIEQVSQQNSENVTDQPTTSGDLQQIQEIKTDKDILEERLSAFDAKTKPGHIWKHEELQENKLHFDSKVVLVKLKYDKFYHAQYNSKVTESKEDKEIANLSSKVNPDYSNVMKLSNEVEAILLPNGDTLVLPPDFKQKVEARRKRLMKWNEEISGLPRGLPPKTSFDRKLNIANVKLGSTLEKTRLCLTRIDPGKEIKRIKKQATYHRWASKKKEEELRQRQLSLQNQRASSNFNPGFQPGYSFNSGYNPATFSPVFNPNVPSQMNLNIAQNKTPIVKNGKVLGYAIPVDDVSKLPPPPLPQAPVMAKILYPNVDDSDWPQLEDYSILEPEVILEEKPGLLLITEKSVVGNKSGPRQVMVNGKLMTLMPYQTINNQRIAEVQATCDICGVKLPKSLLEMHMKMRHKDQIQNRNCSKRVHEDSKNSPPEEVELDEDGAPILKDPPSKKPKLDLPKSSDENTNIDTDPLEEPPLSKENSDNDKNESNNEKKEDDDLVELNSAKNSSNQIDNSEDTTKNQEDSSNKLTKPHLLELNPGAVDDIEDPLAV